MPTQLTFTKGSAWFVSEEITDTLNAIELTFAQEERKDNEIIIEGSLSGDNFQTLAWIKTDDTTIVRTISNPTEGLIIRIKTRSEPQTAYYL